MSKLSFKWRRAVRCWDLASCTVRLLCPSSLSCNERLCSERKLVDLASPNSRLGTQTRTWDSQRHLHLPTPHHRRMALPRARCPCDLQLFNKWGWPRPRLQSSVSHRHSHTRALPALLNNSLAKPSINPTACHKRAALPAAPSHSIVNVPRQHERHLEHDIRVAISWQLQWKCTTLG